VGVPVSAPVAGSKLAQAGRLAMVNVTVAVLGDTDG
jgi:hypothetical protein